MSKISHVLKPFEWYQIVWKYYAAQFSTAALFSSSHYGPLQVQIFLALIPSKNGEHLLFSTRRVYTRKSDGFSAALLCESRANCINRNRVLFLPCRPQQKQFKQVLKENMYGGGSSSSANFPRKNLGHLVSRNSVSQNASIRRWRQTKTSHFWMLKFWMTYRFNRRRP